MRVTILFHDEKCAREAPELVGRWLAYWIVGGLRDAGRWPSLCQCIEGHATRDEARACPTVQFFTKGERVTEFGQHLSEPLLMWPVS